MKPTATIGSLLGWKGRDVWAIAPDASVFEAIAMMAERGIGALLVIEGGRLAGIVSERDYTRKVFLQGRSSKQTSVQEIMTAPVYVASPNDSVEDAMRLMTERRVRHLPIVEGERIVGVVSIGDLVKWTISAQEEHIAQLQNFIAGSYPG
jgi:CBS domain-containing protein